MPPLLFALVTLATGLAFPEGPALSADEKTLYVAQSPLGEITAIDLSTGVKRPFASLGAATSPDGMRFGPDGCLYVALHGDGVVARLSPTGDVLHRYPAGGKHPTNLCFAPGGKSVYVTETETNALIQVPLP